jgi:ubiquitin-protein ligase
MIWYLENYPRHRRERDALESLASTVNWLTPIGWRIDDSVRLIWDADISTPGGTRAISLRYPSHFPHSPPSVLPRGDEERWSEHQYGPGGELCLEYGPDNWHPDITGADMIASAHRLLQGERPAPDQSAAVASRHKTTLGQDLRNKFSRFVATRRLADALAGVPEATMLSASTIGMFNGDSYVHVISSITMPDGQIWLEELPEPLKLGYERPIALFRWPRNAPLPPTTSLTAFRAAAADHNLVLPAVTYAVLLGAVASAYTSLARTMTPFLKRPAFRLSLT